MEKATRTGTGTESERAIHIKKGIQDFRRYSLPKKTLRIIAPLLILTAAGNLFFRHSSGFLKMKGQVPQDFNAYLVANERNLRGENPYVASDILPYKYSPAALILIQGLPQNPGLAWLVFKLICCLLWTGAILLGFRFTSLRDLGYLLLGILVSWKGLLEALDYGQIEFILLFTSVCVARLISRQPFASGLLLGFLPGLKLPWIFMTLPYLLLSVRQGKRSLRSFLAGGLTGILLVLVLLPVVYFGFQRSIKLTRAWILLLQSQPKTLYLDDHNQSLWSTAERWIGMDWMGGGVLSGILILVCLFHLVQTSAKIWSPEHRANLATAKLECSALVWLSPWFILLQLLNPLGWRWCSLFLIGAPLWIAEEARGYPKHKAYVCIFGIGLLLLLQQNPVVKLLKLPHWTYFHQYGLITLFWLSFLIFGNSRSEHSHSFTSNK